MRARRSTVRRDRRAHLLAVGLALAALLALTVGPGTWSAHTAAHDEGVWTLVAAPAPVGPGAVVAVRDGEIRGHGPCNDFRAPWSPGTGVRGDRFVASAVGCDGARAAEEAAYFRLLAGTVRAHVRGDRLELTTAAGDLRFVRRG